MPTKSLAALALGALLPLAFDPYDQAWLAPLALAGLFYLWQRATSPRRAFGYGYLFGLTQFGWGVWWVFVSMHRYSGAGVLEAALLTALFIAFLALYPALAGWAAVRLRRPALLSWPALGLPTVWVAVEWLRGWLFTGFPWLEVGYSQVDSPLAGFAPLLGGYGVGWLTALTASVLLIAWEKRLRAGPWVLVVGSIWLAGMGLRSVAWTQPAGEPFRVALLQGNIAQDLKWQPETQAHILAAYLRLTRRHLDADLIVWPETAVPAFYHEVLDRLIVPLDQQAKAHGVDMLIGIPVLDLDTGRYYNALLSLGRSPGRYDKRHLVPFGEFLPWRSVLGWVLEVLEIPLSDFTPGSRDQKPLKAAGFALAATICYEDAFARDALVGLPQAAYMVNVSNDAWFGDTIAPYQHLQMARMRALEAGRYLLRATNTGITAVIGPTGKVVAEAPAFVQTALTASVVPLAGATPYVILGDWPLGLGVLGVLAWALGPRLGYTSLRARLKASWKSK
ncbi:apolipoprotein N-acyltransferase [Methylothermus subterraneus]